MLFIIKILYLNKALYYIRICIKRYFLKMLNCDNSRFIREYLLKQLHVESSLADFEAGSELYCHSYTVLGNGGTSPLASNSFPCPSYEVNLGPGTVDYFIVVRSSDERKSESGRMIWDLVGYDNPAAFYERFNEHWNAILWLYEDTPLLERLEKFKEGGDLLHFRLPPRHACLIGGDTEHVKFTLDPYTLVVSKAQCVLYIR